MSRFVRIPGKKDDTRRVIVNSDLVEHIIYSDTPDLEEYTCELTMKNGAVWTITFYSLGEILDFIEQNFILFNA